MCHLPMSAGPKHNAAQEIVLIAFSNASDTVSPGARFHLSSHGLMPTASSRFAIFSTAALSLVVAQEDVELALRFLGLYDQGRSHTLAASLSILVDPRGHG